MYTNTGNTMVATMTRKNDGMRRETPWWPPPWKSGKGGDAFVTESAVFSGTLPPSFPK